MLFVSTQLLMTFSHYTVASHTQMLMMLQHQYTASRDFTSPVLMTTMSLYRTQSHQMIRMSLHLIPRRYLLLIRLTTGPPDDSHEPSPLHGAISISSSPSTIIQRNNQHLLLPFCNLHVAYLHSHETSFHIYSPT